MSTDPNDFLMGSGVAGAFGKDDPIGKTVTGVITFFEKRQQTDMDTNKPLTWDDGNPKMQLVVHLRTEERTDAEDDGMRAIYVKGAKTEGTKSMHDAVASAVRAAQARGIEIGGTLTVTYIGNEPSKTKGYNDRKLWSANYVPPDRAAESGDFLGTTEPPVQAPPVAQTAVQPPTQAAPAPAPAPSGDIDMAKKLISTGLDDVTVARASGVDESVVAALRNVVSV